MGDKQKKYIRKLLIILFWVAIWGILSAIINNPLLFAGPLETLIRLCHEMISMKFWQAIGISVSRIMAGFILGILIGSILAMMSYRWHFLKELIAPMMHFSKAVPVASFVVLLLIWWGSAFLSATICFLVVLPMVYVNLLEGLDHTDSKLLEMADVYQMPVINKMFYIYRPALFPFMESCLKSALGMGIKAGIAAEVIGISNLSVGGEMYLSKIYLDTAGVFCWTLVVILISVILEKAVLLFLYSFDRWNIKLTKNRKQKTPFETIRLRGLTKEFRGKKVLSNVNQDLFAGEIVCLMGASGSGKTTLLHVMANILEPNHGQVDFTGKDMGDGKGILHPGMVFQEDRLCENEDAVLNVKLVSPNWVKAIECLRELLPEDTLHIPVKKLSGGMKRRVCIARALAANTDYLIMDEPFSGLDEETRLRTMEVMLKYREGRLMIVATHEESDVKRLSGRLWRLHDSGKMSGV